MKTIPVKIHHTLENMPRMRMCELRDEPSLGNCSGRIQWHHVWTYGLQGQINELWAILGACEGHHDAVKTDKRVKEAFERISLDYATPADFDKYPKRAWRTIKKYLNRDH